MMKKVAIFFIVFFCVAVVSIWPSDAARPGVEPEVCDNGIDDDRDRKIDCNDSDCAGDTACPTGTCGNYTNKDACNADPYCEWVGKGRSGSCSESVSASTPVNQNLGTLDTSFERATHTCTDCHDPIPGGLTPERVDPQVHHDTVQALEGKCTFCHGTIVDDMDDGHYIPTYEPSLVTPWPSGKYQGGTNGEGNCVFCHYSGVHESSFGPVLILDNATNHHNTGLHDRRGTKCDWCHDEFLRHPEAISVSAYSIRTCEGCHGLESLHNIQVDSDGDGIISPGAELPGFGHIGSNDDCQGCHGYSTSAALTRSESESVSLQVAETHHRLVGDLMPLDSDAPASSATYRCVSCHPMTGNLKTGTAVFEPANGCLSCHVTGPPSD